MKNIRIYLIALSALVLTLSCFAEAQAQLAKPGPGPQGLNHTFVSTTGTDSAVCGAQHLPCRDFNAALSRTNEDGVVIALDSGIYAASNITIDKSVTLTAAPGVYAELYNTDSPIFGARITVNAGEEDLVVLRNLYITGKPQGDQIVSGVTVTRVGTLQIENCVIDRFDGLGINFNNSGEFFIKDTIIKNNGAGMQTETGVRATIDHCQFVNNHSDGIEVFGGRVNVRDSVATFNGAAGFRVDNGDLTLDHCVSSNNNRGVMTSISDQQNIGTAIVSNSLVTNNRGYGFAQFGASVLYSLGNNVVRRNEQNTTGTITVISGT